MRCILSILVLSRLWLFATASPVQPEQKPWTGVTRATVPSATLLSGVVNGKVAAIPGTKRKVNQFLGIPFAQPPVGDLRFSPPQVPNNWTQPLNATDYSASCIQIYGSTAAAIDFEELFFATPPPVPDTSSEDCLYVNVYAPSGRKAQKPVMFWIYGGGYQFGTGSLPLYDGTSLAANQDIIVVTFNYRMNIFGFPGFSPLPLTEQNLGLLDQRLALEWVQQNIHAFGGDPRKVTIAGQSAGAESVDDLILTMPENPPFRAAILESGQDTYTIPSSVATTNGSMWNTLIHDVNCSNGTGAEILSGMRAVPAALLTNVTQVQGFSFMPIYDNFTRLPNAQFAMASGNIAKVPILTGSNYDDGSLFTQTSGNNVTEYLAIFGKLAGNLTKLYAPGSPASHGLTNGNEIIARIATDELFFCPSIDLANATIALDKTPAWLYLFNATFPNTQHYQYPTVGAYHTSEVFLVFGTYPQVNQTSEEAALSRQMQNAWADFVKNPEHGPGWAKYPAVQVFETASTSTTTVSDLDISACAEWAVIYELAQSL